MPRTADPGTKLNMYAEFDNECDPGEQDCTPCHYTYNGPVEAEATITHQPSVSLRVAGAMPVKNSHGLRCI